MDQMVWDLGDDVNFMLACKEQELEDSMAYEKLAKDPDVKRVGKFSVRKAESLNDDSMILGGAKVSEDTMNYKHEVKRGASFTGPN